MLGDTLREAREKQGLTYKDIEKGTSIRALYIEYIEKGEYDELRQRLQPPRRHLPSLCRERLLPRRKRRKPRNPKKKPKHR